MKVKCSKIKFQDFFMYNMNADNMLIVYLDTLLSEVKPRLCSSKEATSAQPSPKTAHNN